MNTSDRSKADEKNSRKDFCKRLLRRACTGWHQRVLR